MTPLLRILMLFAIVGPAPMALAGEFEGIVHFKNTTDGRASEFDYFVKGDKSRMEIESERYGGKAAIVMDPGAKKVLMLMPGQKMAMEMPMTEPQAGQSEKAKGELVRTGKTQTILSYPAEQLLYKSDGGETEIWGAKELGYFGGIQRPGSSPSDTAWVQGLKAEGFFPLLVIHRDQAGKESGRMEATKVEKQSLPDDLFVAPPDYKRFDRESMMGNMGGRRGIPGQ